MNTLCRNLALSICLLFLLIVPTMAAQAENDAVQFVTPTAVAQPQNDNERFFNFRLQNFAPATEPLITQQFGTNLTFESEAFWEYPSYYSHALAFATNLPSLSVIEYGPTQSYGTVSAQSDSYYYQHLQYLTGLQPATTYYYRIHVKGYDGTVVQSQGSFTTLTLDRSVIRIPQDIDSAAPPYTLTQSDTKYLLTEDITAPTVAINIKAHNIELDLGGHTIIYDDDQPKVTGSWWNDYAYNEEASFGVRAGLWNYTNVSIFNGTIRQGRNGGTGYIGIGFNPLFLNHMGAGSQNEVAGITVDYYGDSVSGMITGDGEVHHNVILDRGTVVDNRHQGIKAISGDGSAGNTVSYNSLRRFRHQGIMTSGIKHHNELYSDSYDSNSFMIGMGSNGGQVSDNKLFGTGYNPIGISWGSNSIARGNFIYLHGTAPDQRSSEYDRLSGIAGIRLTVYGDANEQYDNCVYEDNTIIVKPWANCPLARGIWVSTDPSATNVVFRHNYVKMEAVSGDIPFEQFNSSLAAVEINGNGRESSSPTYFIDNTLVSNVHHILFGSSYGVGGSAWFYQTQFEKITRYDQYFHPLRVGFWYTNTTNNRLIDSITGEGVDLMTEPRFIGTDEARMEVSLGSTRTITFTNNGVPLSDCKVTVTGGDQQITVQTDAQGQTSFDLLTMTHHKVGSEPAAKLTYSHYTFALDGGASVTMAVERLPNGAIVDFTVTDLSESDWYYADVMYIKENGLMNGISATEFGPHKPMTRGMIVTVLGRLAGINPADYDGNCFDDVATTQYYAPFVSWAADRGIIKGVGENHFAPDANISRQDLAVILNNYAGAMGLTMQQSLQNVMFVDSSDIADYAVDAVGSMVRTGIINGQPGNVFAPRAETTRAEVAAMLHRFCEKV